MEAKPEVFQEALSDFGQYTLEKAVRRAREKGRPMDPWNHYGVDFIKSRLMDEFIEWLVEARMLEIFKDKINKYNFSPPNQFREDYSIDREQDELYDINALATSVWKGLLATQTSG